MSEEGGVEELEEIYGVLELAILEVRDVELISLKLEMEEVNELELERVEVILLELEIMELTALELRGAEVGLLDISLVELYEELASFVRLLKPGLYMEEGVTVALKSCH